MAVPLSVFSRSTTCLFRTQPILVNSIRCKGLKKNKFRTPWGLTVHAGCEVQEKDVIVFQLGLKYHPGLNTGIDPRNNALYATRDGTVVVTTEKFNANKEHELVQKYYADIRGNVYKRYVHVIPPKDEVTFKLIDIV